MFGKQTYVKRRQELSEKLGEGIILFLGNNESPMNFADNSYPFRQDSTFLYYTGINKPSLTLIIDIDEGKEILCGDNLTMDMIVWMGNQPKLEEYAMQCGIKDVRPLNELAVYLNNSVKTNRKVHYLPLYREDAFRQLHDLLGISHEQILSGYSEELIRVIVAQREIKSDEEILEIEKAVNVSLEMHEAAIKMTKPGMFEATIAAEMHKIALASGGDIAFPIIATINGQTLHNHYHGNTLKEGDLLLLDAGAQTEMGYCGDLSSTFPVSAQFTSLQKELYQISLDAHEKAVNKLKPNISFKEVHFEACRVIAEGLKGMGLMKGNIQDALKIGAHALFFPCGTGHMMGLDVHDMENLGEKWVGYDGKEKSTQFGLKSLRLGKDLKPGFVLTIEPGIYFIPELIDLWYSEKRHSEFLNYDQIIRYNNVGGMRNEENFLITDKGARRLGKLRPKTINEIEEIRSTVLKLRI